ncbi:MAG: thiamine diphosphokinase [Chloroflexota bacterium]
MRIVIFANGVLPHPESARQIIQPDDCLIAADGGLRHCLAVGFHPAVLIGDFDSLNPDEVQMSDHQGVEVLRHPRQKDETDLELALRHAVQKNPEKILIFAALGERWDQTLANLLLPAFAEFHPFEIVLIDGKQEITVLNAPSRTTLRLQGQPGDIVSLIPLKGEVQGITTHGLEYPLRNETLIFGSTRGLSNVLQEPEAVIEIQNGSLWISIYRQ